ADFEEPREHEGTDVSEEALDLSSAEAAEEAARSEVTMAEKELAPYRDSQAATQLAAATARHESAANQYAAAEEALRNARDAATDADVEADFEEPREHEGTDVSEEALDLSSAEAAEEAAR
ncbi:hypothetical protein HT105_22780, partial [Bacteroides fragilis]|nr:hypothetical protein [Bacteroides fragilis]